MNKADPFKFERGETVRDKVTGFKGVIVSRGDHISGCNTYGVLPTQLKDGAPQESKWFDEPRLETLNKHVQLDIDTRDVRTGADSVPRSTNQHPRR